MKINKNFAKKAMVVASLTVGVIGANSMFNEVQATGDWGYYFRKCSMPGGKTGGECTASVGNCYFLSSCG